MYTMTRFIFCLLIHVYRFLGFDKIGVNNNMCSYAHHSAKICCNAVMLITKDYKGVLLRKELFNNLIGANCRPNLTNEALCFLQDLQSSNLELVYEPHFLSNLIPYICCLYNPWHVYLLSDIQLS